MSAIRPDLPATSSPVRSQVPAQTPGSAGARSAQAAFFRAAMEQAEAPQRAASSVQPAVTRTTASPGPGQPVDRTARPGSLLDIRV